MSATEVHNASRDAAVGQVGMHLEVEIIPVSDVDRSKEFYQRLARLVRRLHGGGAVRDGRARVTDFGFARGCPG